MNPTQVGFTELHTLTVLKSPCIVVRYWSEEKNEISVRFLKTLFFGHAQGHDVAKKIVDMPEGTGFQLPLSGLISLSSDGPNVNKTIWSPFNKVLLDQGLPELLPFIPCNIHVVHNAFHAGMNAYGEGCDELAIDLFYWLQSSPSRKDCILVLMSFSSVMFNTGGLHLFQH